MEQALAQATPEARQAVGDLQPAAALQSRRSSRARPGSIFRRRRPPKPPSSGRRSSRRPWPRASVPLGPRRGSWISWQGRINDLAQRQSQIHQQANSLPAPTPGGAPPARGDGLQASDRAAQSSKHVQDITDQVKDLAPQGSTAWTPPSRRGDANRRPIESSKLAEAAVAAEQTAKDLTQLATRLGASAEELADPLPTTAPATGPGSPDKSSSVVVNGKNQQEPEQVRATPPSPGPARRNCSPPDAAQLARRQLQVAREMQALTQGDIGAIISSRQKSIAARTEDLANDVELLQAHSGS